MNILVIGNGFDLAHSLPTRYVDFLAFCEQANRVISSEDEGQVEIKVGDCRWQVTKHDPLLNELNRLIVKNAWFNYFTDKGLRIGKNWVDFEKEIGKVVRAFDEVRKILEKEGQLEELQNKNVVIVSDIINAAGITDNTAIVTKESQMSTFIEKNLEPDLNRLIRVLEIYLSEYIEKIDNSIVLHDIKNLSIDHVLSFNYTDTYQKRYRKRGLISTDFIHGKADIQNSIDSNNMVLGIDEYLPEDRRNKETMFIAFKKYYQRILKQTGCEYMDWLKQIEQENKEWEEQKKKFEQISQQSLKEEMIKSHTPRNNLYIFGHSLDVTDGDILKKLICAENVQTKIFYYRETEDDKNTLGKLIANLVKVIGQDELIKRTGGTNKTIEFIPQELKI